MEVVLDWNVQRGNNTMDKNIVTIEGVRVVDHQSLIKVLRAALDAGKAAWPNQMADYVLVNKFQGREEGAERKL